MVGCALMRARAYDASRRPKKVKENNLLELEYRFLKKNDCVLLQMKHLAEWKSHERNHARKEKLVILYSRYMKKVLVIGKGYSGALM